MATRKRKLYDKALPDTEIIYPTEKEQDKIASEIIIRIIRNKATSEDKEYLENIIDSLIKKGAEKVILACTDLSNLIKHNKNTLDTTKILIDSVLRRMYNDKQRNL